MRLVAVFVAYLACIPVANWLVQNVSPVPVGFGQFAPAGVLVAGLAFTLRDLLQHMLTAWRGRCFATLTTLAAVVMGACLSLLIAAPALAVASATAFAVSELLDLTVYTPLAERSFTIAVLASNLVGLIADSIIFLSLAFGSLAYLPGQTIGKLWMTLAAVVVLRLARTPRRDVLDA